MELKPTKAQILWLAEKYNTVPLSTTLPATVTPTQVLQKLKTVSRHCYMLESCEDKESSGRYTFLGFDPQAEIHCKDGKGTVIDENGSRTFTGSPKPHIAALLERHKSPRLRELPTFTGGLVGYFAYDYAKYSEPRLELTAAEDGNFNDVDLMLFDKVIAFDHVKEEIILIFNMNTRDPEAGYRRGQKELEIMCRLVTDSPSAPCPPKARLQADFAPQFDQAAYTAMVEKAKGYIREGDIFQVVLSNSLSAKWRAACLTPTKFCGGKIHLPICSTFRPTILRSPVPRRKHWSSSPTASCLPTHWPAPAPGARPPQRTRRWRPDCCKTKRS